MELKRESIFHRKKKDFRVWHKGAVKFFHVENPVISMRIVNMRISLSHNKVSNMFKLYVHLHYEVIV